MIIPVILFIVGLALLIKGGDWLVDGATGIAYRLHLPEILIGATVVSIGTTLPEVMVSATSAVSGHSEIAYGNAIGSVICNTALIAAITIAARPQKAERRSLILPVCFFFGASVFFAATAYISGSFTRITGVILLLIFLAYMVCTVMQMTGISRNGEEKELMELAAGNIELEAEAEQVDEKAHSLLWEIFFLILGAALITVGSDLLVDNGTLIARTLGVSESVIALTFIALGTSLPELVMALTALVKGHSALSLGNVAGANLFNIVLVSGLAVTLKPFDVPAESSVFGMNASLAVDFPVMFIVMLLLAVPALTRQKLSRVQGIVLLLIYFAYCIFQFLM